MATRVVTKLAWWLKAALSKKGDGSQNFLKLLSSMVFISPARSHKGIFLSQRHYNLRLLEDTSILACKPAQLPMDPKVRLSSFKGGLLEDASLYQRLAKQQSKLFRSSAEAEYRALASTTTAIYIANNPIFIRNTLRSLDKIKDGFIKILSICIQLQLANIFTKPVPASVFFLLLFKMTIIDLHSPS
ncbi:uncharacterized protein LOC111406893 [Olea europaea var. sylvestris]|uniref:uncharacterized protein LOC111406893 n=1 Tax=Olea europaea var. sylvestris TaxID=158386 RepID=UPI000C1D7F2D|nr:uncharacterized protein LOC111406893 [Olea europaea var. sylvestris]